LVGQLEPYGSARTTRRHVVDANGDHVTVAQFAVDRQIEQGAFDYAADAWAFIARRPVTTGCMR
jgi:hypothetical protein